VINELIQDYPEIAAVIMLLLGFLLGRLAQTGIQRLLSVAERLVARFSTSGESIFSPVFIRAFGLFAYSAVLVIAIVLAVRLLDINQLSQWLDQALAYAPQLIIGLFIIGLGNVLGVLARNLVAGLSNSWESSSLVPRFVHGAVLTIAIITGLEHLGLAISFVTQLSLILLAALLGGLSLAFALGARQYVANLLANNELARYHAGERLRIDDDEGTVIDIHQTGIVLSTGEGLVAIPAARLASGRVLKITGEASGAST
jgi:hypothetical protein